MSEPLQPGDCLEPEATFLDGEIADENLEGAAGGEGPTENQTQCCPDTVVANTTDC